jgi:hypothetical protein
MTAVGLAPQVVLADDDVLLREGLASLLATRRQIPADEVSPQPLDACSLSGARG